MHILWWPGRQNKFTKPLMSFKPWQGPCPILGRKSLLILLLIIFFIVKDIGGTKSTQQKKPATLTILSEDGDIVDCIDIYKQPAFNHPLLKNHTIKMEPSFIPTVVGTNYSYSPVQQIWQKNGICPEGTIPIQRVQGTNKHINGEFSECKVEVARLEMQKKLSKWPYLGATGTISAWNIDVKENEWSLNSVSVFNDKNSFLETGWAVSPILFGDRRPRVFANWMDAEKNTGCFNLRCSGFVHLSRGIMLGGALSNISRTGGQQYDYEFTIFKDVNQNVWWAKLQGELIGYWPAILFGKFWDIGRINWGGSVCNLREYGHHTVTQMGSGAFAGKQYRKASFVRRIWMILSKTEYMAPRSSFPSATCDKCYSVEKCSDFLDGPAGCIYYGGPGGRDCNLHCK